jgi:hypothetical protein
MKDNTGEIKEQVIQEYDRLMTKEREENPVRAAFLPRGYYVRMIAQDPRFCYTECYIYQVIKMRYAKK